MKKETKKKTTKKVEQEVNLTELPAVEVKVEEPKFKSAKEGFDNE